MYGPMHSGIGRYVEQLIAHLGQIPSEHEFVVFLKKEAFDLFVLPNTKWKKVLADIHWYGVDEQLHLTSLIKQEDVDLMHFPHWNVPIMYRDPFVVTIHDLIMFHYARQDASTHGPAVYFIKDRLHRHIVKSAATRAKHVFATSEFTKHDIVETLHIDSAKISVTYQAPLTISNKQLTINNLAKKFHIDSPYVLYVGNAYPHKNLETLIDAWKVCSREYPEYQLVFAGKESPWYETLKNNARGIGNIVFTGYVDDSELVQLYQNARLYVFPSLYEGFGLPPLEAMAYGVPVISSSASCLPETLGNAALYFDPTDASDIVRALHEGIRNEDLRYTLRKNAKDELARYSWNTLAKRTFATYIAVLQ
ncbi:MAG: glycosyl transferase, group 1 [Candidatus Magasanikbacteria bacterium GW2011_GWD2_43_18]|uniref:Glycosyl transferase, group 1 n=1 Tax=Candidatus Magasanikbacteria bacterium GW2011_GWE2_42_7 TaxID=1619052 RepID=A0A0G1DM28_9BACT|nr:MAG: glycosyl transferase, group 1 [Candidatus Magasanikbacteria bacterium GW2011_GWC2_42_27]KKS71901.1 MAG: glycosyl transferase, group 1 [Candidatus Magasanikbacteria bacterium GW2011_GWE2_42_7]KKT05078.1 MAG: glycosyl transferase, group 1 [Candidatus Magasanikbacteria bacterium GW2011_GWD2_43_18]KKT25240.1 MAG: glycosyl transferase, group 1 [Candidatus Magasanikbacteria bacterium GW2011_GWA2_43_9]